MRRSVPLIAKAWVLWPPGHDIPEDRVQTMVSGCAPQNVKCNAHMTVFDSFRTRLTNEFERRGCWFMVEVSNWVVGLLRRVLWLSRCLAVNECRVFGGSRNQHPSSKDFIYLWATSSQSEWPLCSPRRRP